MHNEQMKTLTELLHDVAGVYEGLEVLESYVEGLIRYMNKDDKHEQSPHGKTLLIVTNGGKDDALQIESYIRNLIHCDSPVDIVVSYLHRPAVGDGVVRWLHNGPTGAIRIAKVIYVRYEYTPYHTSQEIVDDMRYMAPQNTPLQEAIAKRDNSLSLCCDVRIDVESPRDLADNKCAQLNYVADTMRSLLCQKITGLRI